MMLIAQGLGEYGALAGRGATSEVSSGLRDLVMLVQEFFRDATPAQWGLMGGGAFLLWLVFFRKPR